MPHCLTIRSLRDIHVVCTLGVIVNNAGMNIDIQISVQVSAFSYALYVTRNGITESAGNLCVMFE